MILTLNGLFSALANDSLDAVVSAHSLYAGQRFWSKLAKGSGASVAIGGELIITSIPPFIGLSACALFPDLLHNFQLILTKVCVDF